ncbi:MAG: PEP-CTERM sorting domain-containing protein [Fimbriimonas sp.]
MEEFADFSYANPVAGQTSWDAPGGSGYGFTASASAGLWANDGVLSVVDSDAQVSLAFSGATVSAFGGYFANTDITGAFIPGTVTFAVSSGDSQVVSVGSGPVFIGWVGAPITSASLLASSADPANFVQLDHLIVGAAPVPEPATLLAFAAMTFGLLRRKSR